MVFNIIMKHAWSGNEFWRQSFVLFSMPCETFAAEYDIKFNEKKTVAILFGNVESSECHII